MSINQHVVYDVIPRFASYTSICTRYAIKYVQFFLWNNITNNNVDNENTKDNNNTNDNNNINDDADTNDDTNDIPFQQ